MPRIFNFSAGPAMLPEAVLQQAQQEMLDWQGTGMSVMEMSHRGEYFLQIAAKMKQGLIDLLNIPKNYQILFLQGGATAQFALIPQNILNGKTKASYVNTGAWSIGAIHEAEKYCTPHIVATAEASHFTTIPDYSDWQLDHDSAYLHYTSNETIQGVEFPDIPAVDLRELPLVCDMSSNILSRSIDVSRFGLIYAGAQKNMGPAGVTVVIIRDDLIGMAQANVPSVFNYELQYKADSMLNTPASYNWYLIGLVLEWLKAQGGLAEMENLNQRKADKLYTFIDQSALFSNPVDIAFRSRMNVPFFLADQNLDAQFLKDAEQHGLSGLKGHRLVGGMRASIYNAMPEKGITALIDFMSEFERTH